MADITNKTAQSEPANQRMQSAMVLFSLEEALGTYVISQTEEITDMPSRQVTAIETRSNKRFDSVSSVVHETYIGEVIDLAIASSKGTTADKYLRKLKQLIDDLAIFEVRNAVCHPNRPFPENFWYRMATIATDPCFENLRLTRVQDAFRSAVEGRIIPPPDGWFSQRMWAVPNNLPTSFEHEITGLVARKDECTDLLRRVSNTRFHLVAVVGPGGSGKTALCLEALRMCATDAATLNWADQIVYLSAKTEKLTATGIEPINDLATSLDDVKKQIVMALGEDNWQTTIDSQSERRLLLCIDNLETLLRNQPEEFDSFADSLPTPWRLVVTSRISVNSANVITLGRIKKDGAVQLARSYLTQRGGERLNKETLEQLVEACDRNPLAIRLTIDSYLAGVELHKAISNTKENVVAFSYSNLVEVLLPSAIKILECLFASEHAENRTSIGDLLGFSADEVAEGLNQLLKTSLVNRQTSENQELYALSSSVRELLLKHPRDVASRSEVQAKLRKRRLLLSEVEVGAQDPLDPHYISSETSEVLRALAAKVFRSLQRTVGRTSLLSNLNDISRALEFSQNDAFLFRLKGLVLRSLGDHVGALEAITRSASVTKIDPASVLLLAMWLQEDNRIEEAFDYTTQLIAKGWDKIDRAGIDSVARLIKTHWVCALWLKRIDTVLEATADWETPTELATTRGSLRISAFRRKCEGKSTSEKQGYVVDALNLCETIFNQHGYVGAVVHEAVRALQDFSWYASADELNTKIHAQLCAFVAKHLTGMCATHRTFSLDSEDARNLVMKLQSLDCGTNANAVKDSDWIDRYGFGDRDTALEEAGYVEARISHIPTRLDGTPRDFLFARALDGTREYYVHRETAQLSTRDFTKLQTGQVIRVLPGDRLQEGSRAFPTRDVII